MLATKIRALVTIPPHSQVAEAQQQAATGIQRTSAVQLLCCCSQLQWPLLLQDPGLFASDAAALRDQLAAAQEQAQAAAAEAATLQQRLASEATAAAGERQQLEAQLQQLEAERRQLETDQEAARAAAAEHCGGCGGLAAAGDRRRRGSAC